MTLAELAVKITANTAEFITGFSNAGLASKRFREDLTNHVQAIGGTLDGVLSHFGEFGAAIGQSLGQATQSAGAAISAFGKLGGAAGTLAGIGVGAAAGILAIDAGIVGIAVHTAESIAKMNEMAQAAGVPIEALSSLGFAGKEVGIDLETTVKSLEKMNKSVFAAATAAPGAVNAFTRLHIAVRDVGGQIRPVTDIFGDLAAKFAAMPDGVTKTALAIQVFGRGGAAIIPLLNQGRDAIKEMTDTASALGLVIDQKTAAAAAKFKENLVTIEGAGQGAAIMLTEKLLPAMNAIAGQIVEAFKTGEAQKFIDVLADIVKWSLVVGRALVGVAEEVRNLFSIGKFNPFSTSDGEAHAEALGGQIADKLKAGDFKGAAAATRSGLGEIFGTYKDFGKNTVQIVSDTQKSIREILSGKISDTVVPPKPTRGGDVDAAQVKEPLLERIKARIEALTQEAANWAKVASAGTQAEQLIAEATKKSDEEFGKLKAEAAKSPAALALVIKDEGLIKSAAAAAVFGAEVKKIVGDLDKAGLKFDENSKAADAMAAAYEKGGAAIAAAAIDKKLEPERLEVERLAAEYALAKSRQDEYIANRAKLGPAGIGPVQGQNIDPSILKSGLDVATAQLAADREKLAAELTKELTESLKQQGSTLLVMKPYVDGLNDSYLQGETAVRKARIALELYRFEQDQLAKGIVLTTDQKQKERAILEESDREAYEGALKQEAAQFSLNAQYDSQILKLQRLKEVLQENGQSTLLIDARLHDAQDSLIHQWDEAAFKVGTFSQKFKGVMGELAIQGRAAGQAISQAFMQAIDGVETNLAKLLTGQKTNFKQVVQGLAESVTKAEIQKGVGSLADKFGIKIPGLTAKADGSSESLALWVRMSGSAAGAAFPTSNIPLFGAPASGSSGGLGGLLSFFGGFRAEGGDMSPGSWYVAGEKGPEIVKGPGTVVPNHALGSRTTNNHFHYGNAASRDIFGRTEKQTQARHMRNLRLAN